MVPTVMIHGSDNEVMAPIDNGHFIKGKRRNILIIASGDDDIPLSVRQALVGITLSSIFDSEQFHDLLPPGGRLVYSEDAAEALEAANEAEAAYTLIKACTVLNPRSKYNFLVFKEGEYAFAT